MLKITIEGNPGEGKTSLAVTVATALAENGMEVDLKDIDLPTDDLATQAKIAGNAVDRLRGLKVVVESVQLPREGADSAEG
jgi:Mrp family chromosome partitioning ATPase